MQSNLYDTIKEKFCFDQCSLENARFKQRNGLLKTIRCDFDLIVLSPKKIIFFAVVDASTNNDEVVQQLKGALNIIAQNLSLSLNDFVVCGANEDSYFFWNRYNERLFVFARASDEEAFLIEHIENEFSYTPAKFDGDTTRKLYDALLLSVSQGGSLSSTPKTMTTADGKTYVHKHGSWREASDLNPEILFPITAFGGILGFHLFYQKRRASGVLYLLTFGLCGIGWLFDVLELLLGIYRDKEGKYLVPLENRLSGIIILVIAVIVFVAFVLFFPSLYNSIFGSFKF